MVAVGAWPVPLAPYGRRGGVAGSLRTVRLPWGRGQYPGPRMATGGRGRSTGPRMVAVGVWPVSWISYGRRGNVAGPLNLVWLPWGRGRYPGSRMAAEGGCRFPGPSMAAVGAWPVPWTPYGCRGGVAIPLSFVWLLWGRGRSPAPRIIAVGVWAVPWAPYGRRRGVAHLLGPVWPPWGRDWFSGCSLAAVWAWLVPWARLAVVGAKPVPWIL